ncbi:hypothetical protein [uncultured Roseibium sp.]|uniref:hypothetical protein n=1 Tax=uncultured Roseibium sp. TaxID=1936171 RepID=UPI0032161FAC
MTDHRSPDGQSRAGGAGAKHGTEGRYDDLVLADIEQALTAWGVNYGLLGNDLGLMVMKALATHQYATLTPEEIARFNRQVGAILLDQAELLDAHEAARNRLPN